MGRFATTAALYEQFRTPYPPEFFREVAERLSLSRQHTLIDLGTGPGLLALGFAPYVGRITGVDPEPAMVAAAREAARRKGQPFTLIEGRAEDLPPDIGRFDLVTIGRALHWMDPGALGPMFERLVAPKGMVAICASFSARDDRNGWLDEFNAVRRVWSPENPSLESRAERTHRELAAVLEGTGFRPAETIRVETTHEVGVGDLARRVLTFSTSSPEILGDRVEAMLSDMERRLAPLSRDGILTEVVISLAQVARRASEMSASAAIS